MIKTNEKHRLECDEPKCEEYVSVRLILLACGAFTPDIPAHAQGWQALIDGNNPMAPIRGRCPFHAQKPSRIIQPGLHA